MASRAVAAIVSSPLALSARADQSSLSWKVSGLFAQCVICNKVVPNTFLMRGVHLTEKHQHPEPYECGFQSCPERFPTVMTRSVHWLNAHGSPVINRCQDPDCDHETVTTYHIEQLSHWYSHFNWHFICPYCPASRGNPLRIGVHVSAEHSRQWRRDQSMHPENGNLWMQLYIDSTTGLPWKCTSFAKNQRFFPKLMAPPKQPEQKNQEPERFFLVLLHKCCHSEPINPALFVEEAYYFDLNELLFFPPADESFDLVPTDGFTSFFN